MPKVKLWEDISEEAQTYFNRYADWMNHFSKDVIEEAQDYYAVGLETGETGRGQSARNAWHYAQGASRFMQRPTTN